MDRKKIYEKFDNAGDSALPTEGSDRLSDANLRSWDDHGLSKISSLQLKRTFDLAKSHYQIAEEYARTRYQGNKLMDFVGHGPDHVFEVAHKVENLHFLASKQGGQLDLSTIMAAAAFHDSGMDAGLGLDRQAAFMSLPPEHRPALANLLTLDSPREQHALLGAKYLLGHRDELAKLGTNPDQAALLIYLHSKRGFLEKDKDKNENKILDLSQPDYADLKMAALDFKKHCTSLGINWDMSWLQDQDGNWDDSALRRTSNSASALRLADSCRDGSSIKAQNGSTYGVSGDPTKVEYQDFSEVKSLVDNSDRIPMKEIQNVTVFYDDGSQCRKLENGKSKAIVLGERNVAAMSLDYNFDGTPILQFDIIDSRLTGCSAYVLQERIDEVRYSAYANLSGQFVVTGPGEIEKITGLLDLRKLPKWKLTPKRRNKMAKDSKSIKDIQKGLDKNKSDTGKIKETGEYFALDKEELDTVRKELQESGLSGEDLREAMTQLDSQEKILQREFTDQVETPIEELQKEHEELLQETQETIDKLQEGQTKLDSFKNKSGMDASGVKGASQKFGLKMIDAKAFKEQNKKDMEKLQEDMKKVTQRTRGA